MKNCVIQAVTTFKYSDNILRTRVSTINLNYLKEPQMKDLMRGFDEQAAVVIMARIAS